MEFDGYMIKVWCDDQTLRVRGTTKMGRVALAGEQHGDGDVVIPRDQIAEVVHKPASVMTNGRMIVRTVEGRRYTLHFRRKHQDDFARLAEALAPQA